MALEKPKTTGVPDPDFWLLRATVNVQIEA
jgi:hypothetical protein